MSNPQNEKIAIATPSKRRELATFEHAIGGRSVLVEEMQEAELDPAQQRLLALLEDPGHSHVSLATLCKLAGLRMAEVIQFMRDHTWNKAFLAAHRKFAERLSGVAEQVALEATNHTERCGCTYGATGEIPANPDCKNCKGKGLQYFRGSHDHQTTVLEVMGLLKKGGGVTVNNQQNVGVKVGDAFFDKFVKATDAEITVEQDRSPQAIEGEVSGTDSERPR